MEEKLSQVVAQMRLLGVVSLQMDGMSIVLGPEPQPPAKQAEEPSPEMLEDARKAEKARVAGVLFAHTNVRPRLGR